MCPAPHFFDFIPNLLKNQADQAKAEQKKIEQEQQRQRIEAFTKTRTYKEVTQDLTKAFENIDQKLQASAQEGRYGDTLIDYRGEPAKCWGLRLQYEAFKQQIRTPGVDVLHWQYYDDAEASDETMRCILYTQWRK